MVTAKYWLIPGALLLVVGFFLLKTMMHGALYPAVGVPVGRPPSGYTELMLEWDSRESAVAWFCAGKSGTHRPSILYFHGNGENLETLRASGFLDMLRAFDCPVLVVDYPGYGRSPGKASEAGILKMADAAVQRVKALNPGAGWISAGWSLGAAVAVQAAARNGADLRGLVVMSGWSSLRDAAAVHFPVWLVRLFASEDYDSATTAAAIHCPVLILHGENDDLIPVAQGKKLAGQFSSAKWIPLPEVGHNDLPGNPVVHRELDAFLSELFRARFGTE